MGNVTYANVFFPSVAGASSRDTTVIITGKMKWVTAQYKQITT